MQNTLQIIVPIYTLISGICIGCYAEQNPFDTKYRKFLCFAFYLFFGGLIVPLAILIVPLWNWINEWISPEVEFYFRFYFTDYYEKILLEYKPKSTQYHPDGTVTEPEI